ncbi:MAG TPA: polymer-forming cytoskeletal protein [Polyangiaceae bacterium]|jgi:cytoskeletal protein CcmA (bactofilin family)
MPAKVSVIGRATRVHGRVTGGGDLEVDGFVDGEVAVEGDVTVDAHGMVGAGVRGRRVVVRGAVKGDLVGEEAVLLEEGARVVGDVRAPRVAIASGALVRGFVETGDSNGVPAKVARPQVAARVAPPVASAPKPAAAAAPVATVASKPSSAPSGVNNSSANAGPRRPPPPVVPALKKVKGQVAKRKER